MSLQRLISQVVLSAMWVLSQPLERKAIDRYQAIIKTLVPRMNKPTGSQRTSPVGGQGPAWASKGVPASPGSERLRHQRDRAPMCPSQP